MAKRLRSRHCSSTTIGKPPNQEVDKRVNYAHSLSPTRLVDVAADILLLL